MQFGVQFFPNFRPSDKSAAAYFAESLAIAEEAETLGYTPRALGRALFRALWRL